ncbi:glycosyltransferase family 4 protein [Halobacteriovorax sp. JY17]|uniref:glycosyltransferase family 4 protein n=1 Tax=Halobacteriovorax sp. JY17 TaxID=2014617 RepID=UPI0025C0A63E|nr:glycosyltransferase family 4 protein [Halobacteriovorax sp. JY17]
MLPENSEIVLITTKPNRYHNFKKEAPNIEKKGKLTLHRVDISSHQSGVLDQAKAFIYFTLAALKIIKNERYDLVFATSSRLMTAFLGALVSYFFRIPLFLDIRDIFLDTVKDVFGKKANFVYPFFFLVERVTIKRARKINLVSKGFLPYFEKRYSDKCYSFYTNGIDQEFLNINYNRTLEEGKINILYAGNIGEGQGLHQIIPSLAKRLRDIATFKIIGNGGRRELLYSCLLKDNRLKNVTLLPPVSREELIYEYQQCDVLFLHLNNYKAFEKVLPSKLFEYGATGKPILAGVSGYAAKFCKEHLDRTAIFHPCNTDEAVEAFGRLDLGWHSRDEFVDFFKRERLMDQLACDVLSIMECK